MDIKIKKLELWDDRTFIDCTFEVNGVEETVTRKIVKRKKESVPYLLVSGKKVYFSIADDGACQVVRVADAYEVKPDRKIRSTTEGLSNGKAIDLTQVGPLEFKVDFKAPAIEKCPVKVIEEGAVFHREHETIKTCIMSDIPVYLVGPAGSGKNYTLEMIAAQLGLDFYFTNSVQQEYKLTGFIDAGGRYHETEFYKAFRNGGLFFLDEMDSSIPEVLVLINAAIANKYFEFPVGCIQAHKDFRVAAAGNTVGSGADDMYTGRMVLDQATLDRFAIIKFDYDEAVELSIAGGDHDIVDLVHDMRSRAERTGIRATFSYRCIEMIKKLRASGMSMSKIMDIAVCKGLDNDTKATLKIAECKPYRRLIQREANAKAG